MKEKTWKEKSTDERGKKRFLERLEQTRIANKEIEDFSYEDCANGSEPSGFDGERPERS